MILNIMLNVNLISHLAAPGRCVWCIAQIQAFKGSQMPSKHRELKGQTVGGSRFSNRLVRLWGVLTE